MYTLAQDLGSKALAETALSTLVTHQQSGDMFGRGLAGNINVSDALCAQVHGRFKNSIVPKRLGVVGDIAGILEKYDALYCQGRDNVAALSDFEKDHVYGVTLHNIVRNKTTFLKYDEQIFSVRYSACGNYVIVAAAGANAIIYRIVDAHAVCTLPHQCDVWIAVLSPCRKYAITATATALYVWNIKDFNSPSIMHTIHYDSEVDLITDMVFTPGGDYFALLVDEKVAQLFSTRTGHREGEIGSSEGVERVFFNALGTVAYTCGNDSTIAMWSTRSCKKMQALEHDDWVSDVATHPRCPCMISSAANTVMLWNMASGKLLQKMTFAEKVKNVTLSSCGTYAMIVFKQAILVLRLAQGKLTFLQRQRFDTPLEFAYFSQSGTHGVMGFKDDKRVCFSLAHMPAIETLSYKQMLFLLWVFKQREHKVLIPLATEALQARYNTLDERIKSWLCTFLECEFTHDVLEEGDTKRHHAACSSTDE